MRLGFTGTQRGTSPAQRTALRGLLTALGPYVTHAHHGDCVGADEEFHAAVREVCPATRIVVHPPENARKRAFCAPDEQRPARPYLVRNRWIAQETALLVACPAADEERIRSGTWSTVRAARRLGRPIVILGRDGTPIRDGGQHRIPVPAENALNFFLASALGGAHATDEEEPR